MYIFFHVEVVFKFTIPILSSSVFSPTKIGSLVLKLSSKYTGLPIEDTFENAGDFASKNPYEIEGTLVQKHYLQKYLLLFCL